MKYNIIACINSKHALGRNGRLLYHIKEDMELFKSLTTGNIVVMGRKTYESIPNAPLKNRINVIITSDVDYLKENKDPNIVVVHSFDEAVSYCDKINDKECFVIGGASIYNTFLEKDIVDTLYITYVYEDDDGDVFFPDVFTDGRYHNVHEYVKTNSTENNIRYMFSKWIR